MTKNTKSFVLPLAFIGVMFFSLGFALGINSVLVPRIEGITGNQFGRIISDHCRHFHPVPYFWLSGKPYNQKNRIQTNNGPFIPYVCHSLRTFHTIGKL